MALKEFLVLLVQEANLAILDHLDHRVFQEFKEIRVILALLEKKEAMANLDRLGLKDLQEEKENEEFKDIPEKMEILAEEVSLEDKAQWVHRECVARWEDVASKVLVDRWDSVVLLERLARWVLREKTWTTTESEKSAWV